MEFRTYLQNKDKNMLEIILKNTEFFNIQEVNIALELIDDYLQKKENSDYRFLLAYEPNKKNAIMGYSCFGHIPGTLNNYDLYWIVVALEEQNKGIGKQILTKTEEIIVKLGGNELFAETSGRKQYYHTQQFYIRNNFIMKARLKNFYAPNDDKLIFAKTLGA